MKRIFNKVRRNWVLLLVFIAISAAISGTVVMLMRWNANRVYSEAGDYLAALGKMKATQISLWNQERILDGQTIQTDRGFADDIVRLLSEKNDLSLIKVNQDRLRSILLDPNYSTIYLYDNLGGKVMAMGDLAFQPNESSIEKITEIHKWREINLTELYIDEHGAATMDMLVPIYYSGLPGSPIIGVLVFCINPDTILYPLIQEIPTENQTTETPAY